MAQWYSFEETTPDVHPDARVARDAVLVGDVTVRADASVWPGVVIRGDVGPAVVGRAAHVGDNAVMHASTLGPRVMVGHGAVLDETTVEEGALVGFNATLSTGVHIGARSIVAAGAVVPEGATVPPESFVRGVPATMTPLSETTLDADSTFTRFHSGAYTDLAARHTDLFDRE